MSINVPIFDKVTLQDLERNPYPIYAKMRDAGPVVWLSCAKIHIVSRFDDIHLIERDAETFPALDPRSLQIQAVGHSMMRKDGAAHRALREVCEATFRPATVAREFAPRFNSFADQLLEEIAQKEEIELISDYSAPLASKCLIEVTGLRNISWKDMILYSQALIDGVGNYAQDAEVWRRCHEANQALDLAIDERASELRGRDEPSVLCRLANAGLPVEDIRSNIKVIIGGGLNEPRDATASAVYGLLLYPSQKAKVTANGGLWKQVFEETIRWLSPIGMYPRRVAKTVPMGDATLEEGDQIGLAVASGCHDERQFERADEFDLTRPARSHLAFGAGPHFCLGTWVARQQVGVIAVPRLLQTFPDIALSESEPVSVSGWVFRAPDALHLHVGQPA